MKSGVIVECAGRRLFVSARQALAVVEAPRPTGVPGADFSLVWFEGEVLVAVPFETCVPGGVLPAVTSAIGAGEPSAPALRRPGARRPAALICELGDRRYGLTGVEVLASGRFEPAGASGILRDTLLQEGVLQEGVLHDGVEVPECVLEEPKGLVGDPAEPAPAVSFRGTLFDGEASERGDPRASGETDDE